MYMKKILVFSCIGGGGHVSAVQALRSCLEDTYHIKAVEVFQDVLKSSFFPDGCWNGGLNFYNYLLQTNKPFLCNMYVQIFRFMVKRIRKSIKKTLCDYLAKEKPDLIISVIPYFNFYILQAAQELNIPFLIIPSDINVSTYSFDFAPFSHHNAYITMHFDNDEMHKHLEDVGFKPDNITVVGAPVRQPFIEKKDKEEFKKKWSVVTNNPIILIMMGAQGSRSVISYCQQIALVKAQVSVFVCIGKSEALKRSINNISFPANIDIHIVGFTPDIDELMVIADLFITKTGGISVCEGLYVGVPMLLDATSVPLDWERYNYDFVLQNGFGELLTHIDCVASRIDYLLAHRDVVDRMRECMADFKKKNSQQEIPALVSRILK